MQSLIKILIKSCIALILKNKINKKKLKNMNEKIERLQKQGFYIK